MATPRGGTPLDAGLIERVSGALRYVLTGQTPPWFGPNDPLLPVAPPEVKGRHFDFPAGVNLNYTPRSESTGDNGISFSTLRRVADPAHGGLDLVRIAIETRKDQMEGQKWTIRARDGRDCDGRAATLAAALRRPDLVHTFRQWARQLWEDLLVIDAPTVYLRPMADGFKIPEVMDGALLKRLVDSNGRTPLPPEPAYQQILKGLPAVDYGLSEVLCMPRNLRSNRLYGMSPVEQVVNIIGLALKRQLHLSAYYTEGNVPEMLIACPEAWQPDQITYAQQLMDSMLQGNIESKRKMVFVPGGMEPKPLKDPKLKDELDDWLARVICWCFNLSPSALVKDTNRATAETARETALMEGLEPLKAWWSDFMNEVIYRCWGIDDLEFCWIDEEIVDALTKAQTTAIAMGGPGKGWMTADEARALFGMEPLTPEQQALLAPPNPFSDLTHEARSQKLEKKKPKVKHINRNRAAAKRASRKINAIVNAYLQKQYIAIRDGLGIGKLAKAEFDELWNGLSEEDRKRLVEQMAEILGDMAADGADEAITSIAAWVPDADMDAILSQANERAIAWAENRAAELVTQIDETTRDGIRDLTVRSLEEGWSTQEISDRLDAAWEFGGERSDMIARTEVAFADIQGNLAGYRESGVVEGREWVIAQDEYCEDCESMSGMVVPIGGDFPGGDPPLHPNCRCDILPIITSTGD